VAASADFQNANSTGSGGAIGGAAAADGSALRNRTSGHVAQLLRALCMLVSRRTSAVTSLSITETSRPGFGRWPQQRCGERTIAAAAIGRLLARRRGESDQSVAAVGSMRRDRGPTADRPIDGREVALEIVGQRIVPAGVEEDQVGAGSWDSISRMMASSSMVSEGTRNVLSSFASVETR